MTADHYATLGVAPTSEDVVIRAAYVALMRRYHPDSNASPAAAERAKAITVAYAVLGDPGLRADYDRRRQGDSVFQRTAFADEPEAGWFRRLRLEPIAMLAAVLLLLLLPLYLIRNPLAVAPPPGSARAEPARPGSARLARAPDPQAACTSRAAHDLVKRQLVERAGDFHRGPRAGFERMAADSFVRIDSTISAVAAGSDGRIECRALVALLVPPGLAPASGKRVLTAELDYSLDTAPGRDALVLANADALARQLATIAPLRRPDESDEPVALAEAMPEVVRPAPIPRQPAPRIAPVPTVTRPTARPVAPPRPRAAPAGPAITASFNCRFARGRGETAVCKNANLAALDRQLAVFYGQSLGHADAAKRSALLKSSQRFQSRRDECRSESCRTDAYLSRMREVADIMAGPASAR